MVFKLTTSIALLALCTLGSANLLQNKNFVNQRISEYFLKSSALIEANPRDFFDCFYEYNPQINDLTVKYEEAYGSCLNTAESSRDGLNTEFADKRSALEGDAGDTCSRFDDCNENSNDALTFFQCYTSAANDATRKTNIIGNTANAAVQDINYRLGTIQYDEDVCTTTASQDYVRETSKVYDDLDDCLNGKTKPPVTTTTPIPTEDPETTTEEPETPPPTEDPETTTEEPETPPPTEDPETTTEEPETPPPTEDPETTTEEPETPPPTEDPETTTEEPETPPPTEDPETTTEEPETPPPTEDPETTTEEPETPPPTEDPETTTEEPETPPPTEDPETTTEEPETPPPTEDPETTTEEPETPPPTEDPETTTEEPETPPPTEDPETTTEEPETPPPTEDPETTTEEPETPPPTEDPETTTEEPETPPPTEDPETTTEDAQEPEEPSPEEDLDIFKNSRLNVPALRKRALKLKSVGH